MNDILANAIVIAITVASLVALFLPKVSTSTTWRATVTPLASIIGSGFLVLGPILKHNFEVWSSVMMGLLCLIAYLFGYAIRFNIQEYDRLSQKGTDVSRTIHRVETFASAALVVAYVVSITYYLNLFGAFAVSLTAVNDTQHARLITSGILVFICLLGWSRGFKALEPIEETTVNLKLSIIAGLLAGLAAYTVTVARTGSFDVTQPDELDWRSFSIGLGLIITVQGFETSRYLGDEYDAQTRIRTMKLSQWISAGIYLLYITLVTFLFTGEQVPDSETGIIQMTELVAPVLPAMLVMAALAAQFSAAVADTGGCGGLAEEVSGQRISSQTMYAILLVAGLILTWVMDIYTIISYASRAFAFYYALQCLIALLFTTEHRTGRKFKRIVFAVLGCVALIVVIFGRPAE